MMDHGTVRDLLARRAELTPTEEASLQDHLQACPECRATATAYSRQSAMLREQPQVAPPPALRAGVRRQIAERPVSPWWRAWPALAALPVAVAAAVVLALVFHSPGHTPTRSASSHLSNSAPTATFTGHSPSPPTTRPAPVHIKRHAPAPHPHARSLPPVAPPQPVTVAPPSNVIAQGGPVPTAPPAATLDTAAPGASPQAAGVNKPAYGPSHPATGSLSRGQPSRVPTSPPPATVAPTVVPAASPVRVAAPLRPSPTAGAGVPSQPPVIAVPTGVVATPTPPATPSPTPTAVQVRSAGVAPASPAPAITPTPTPPAP